MKFAQGFRCSKKVVITTGLVWIFWLSLLAGFHVWSLSQGRGGFSPVVAGKDDGEVYLQLAMDILAGVRQYYPNAYPYVLAFFMKYLGIENIFTFKLINLFITMICSFLVIKTVGTLARESLLNSGFSSGNQSTYVERTQCVAIIILGIYPSLSVFGFSFSILRDGWVYAIFALSIFASVNCVEKINSEKFLRSLIFVGVSIFTLYFFRWYLSLSIGIGWCIFIFTDLLFGKKGESPKLRKVYALCFFCVAGFVGAYYGLHYQTTYHETFSLTTYRDAYHAIDAVGSNMGITYGDHPWYLWPGLYLLSFLINCFAPFPWQITNLFWLAASLEGAVILYLFISVNRHVKDLGGAGRFLFIQAIIWLLVVAFFNDNIGTALRLRVPAVLLLIILRVTLPTMGRRLYHREFPREC